MLNLSTTKSKINYDVQLFVKFDETELTDFVKN